MVKSFSSKNLKEHGRFDDDMPDWMDDLVKISFKEQNKRTLRPVTPMIMMARHWPVSLTSGKNCPPMWCPKFNSESQKFDLDYACNLHDHFGERWKAQKVIILGAIDREWQEEGRKNPVGLLVLPGGTSVALVQAVGINKYDVSDPQKGCDLSVVYNKDAPPANQWSIMRTERTPLTDEEQAYKIPDLDKLSPDFGNAKYLAMFTKEMKRKLANFGYYVTPLDNDEEGWKAYKKDINGQPYTEFKDLVELVGDGKQKDKDAPKKRRDDEEEERPNRNKLKRHHDIVDDEEEAQPKKAKKPPVDDDEDGDSSDGDDEDEKPAPKKKAAPPPDDDEDDTANTKAKKKAVPVDDDEDEAPPKKAKKPVEEDEDDGDEDEEDEKPAKKAKKAADKDEDSEAPFDPDEEDEKPAKKPKQLGPPDGSEDWSETYSISWKKNDEGEVVPKCFGVFAGAKKCRECPAKKACTAADEG